jgi:hypothetical protein
MQNGVECPDCQGEGHVRAIGCGKKGPVALIMDCELCGNTGSIDAQRHGWLEEGRKLKDDRISRGLVMRKEAERRGMNPVELSKMERGIIAPIKG